MELHKSELHYSSRPHAIDITLYHSKTRLTYVMLLVQDRLALVVERRSTRIASVLLAPFQQARGLSS
jgi:hypothetical protein